MPRAKKTQYANRSDLREAPAPSAPSVPSVPKPQPPTSAPNQPYGERKDQEESQRVMPLPDFNAILDEAQNQNDLNPVGLGDPSARPTEPVTTGLPVGPGGGPEVLRKVGTRASDVLDNLAATLKDGRLQELAEIARLRGN